jgi:hypothetical protein
MSVAAVAAQCSARLHAVSGSVHGDGPARQHHDHLRPTTTRHRGTLQTSIHDYHLPNPVVRSHCGHGFVKQYVRDHLLLRTEPAANDVGDYGVRKAVEHLPAFRRHLAGIVVRCLDARLQDAKRRQLYRRGVDLWNRLLVAVDLKVAA